MQMQLASLAVMMLFAAAHGQTSASTGSSALEVRLKAIAAEHHGDVALYAENLDTHESIGLRADEPVQTASVIKLTILYEALEQIRAGKAHFDDRIELNKAEQVPGSGMLLFFDTPIQLTFKDVLTMMVVVSDNTATNLAIDHLGLENIDARIAKLGLKNTYLYKKVFTPVDPGQVMLADQKKFGLGKTTPREIGAVMEKLVRCELAEPGAAARAGDAALCAAAVKMLQLQFYRTAIPRFLLKMPGAQDTSIANKTGSLDAVRNDVAAISTKHGMVILACFTFDNQDRSWGAEQEGELTIAKLAKALLENWSPEGLAAWPAGIQAAGKVIDKSGTK